MKTESRKLGKKIRSITGLKLPIAMVAAKLIVRGREMVMLEKEVFQGLFKYEMFPCGAECCGSRGPVLRGPKGGFDIYTRSEV